MTIYKTAISDKKIYISNNIEKYIQIYFNNYNKLSKIMIKLKKS